MGTNPQGAPQNPNPDYQDRDIQIKPIVYFVIGLAVLTVITVIAMALLFRVLDQRMERAEADIPPEARERVLPPEPRLTVDEPMALEEYQAQSRAILENYAIVDEASGVVRIPIDEAIELVAERGLPRWAAPRPAAAPEVEEVEEGGEPQEEVEESL